jgi:hypothetical protein
MKVLRFSRRFVLVRVAVFKRLTLHLRGDGHDGIVKHGWSREFRMHMKNPAETIFAKSKFSIYAMVTRTGTCVIQKIYAPSSSLLQGKHLPLKRIQPLPVSAGFFICIRNSLDQLLHKHHILENMSEF